MCCQRARGCWRTVHPAAGCPGVSGTASTALQRTAPPPSHSPRSLHTPPLPAEDRMTGIAASERFLELRTPLASLHLRHCVHTARKLCACSSVHVSLPLYETRCRPSRIAQMQSVMCVLWNEHCDSCCSPIKQLLYSARSAGRTAPACLFSKSSGEAAKIHLACEIGRWTIDVQ